MNTHYIPQLLLRQFATGEKVNTYNFITDSFQTKKIKHVFAEKDLFDPELERLFSEKLESRVGDLLNNKLLSGKRIILERKENLLLRKFLMINFLRSPLTNMNWDEIMEKTKMQEDPYIKMTKFFREHSPEFEEAFHEVMPSKESYIPNLKTEMEYDSLEDIADPENEKNIPKFLQLKARLAMVTAIAFWDCEETGQEFIMTKIPGVSMMDNMGISYKLQRIKNLWPRRKESFLLSRELQRLEYGTMMYVDNFSIYPLSSTRALICFSPYFRAFFPMSDPMGTKTLYPPLLDKKQFDKHFFEPMRMELFKPCRAILNTIYEYEVKPLKKEEVWQLNSLLLNMETEEFVFHDYMKIKDSFEYYDKKSKLVMKKHDFSKYEI